jgi:hypothetical protein
VSKKIRGATTYHSTPGTAIRFTVGIRFAIPVKYLSIVEVIELQNAIIRAEPLYRVNVPMDDHAWKAVYISNGFGHWEHNNSSIVRAVAAYPMGFSSGRHLLSNAISSFSVVV